MGGSRAGDIGCRPWVGRGIDLPGDIRPVIQRPADEPAERRRGKGSSWPVLTLATGPWKHRPAEHGCTTALSQPCLLLTDCTAVESSGPGAGRLASAGPGGMALEPSQAQAAQGRHLLQRSPPKPEPDGEAKRSTT